MNRTCSAVVVVAVIVAGSLLARAGAQAAGPSIQAAPSRPAVIQGPPCGVEPPPPRPDGSASRADSMAPEPSLQARGPQRPTVSQVTPMTIGVLTRTEMKVLNTVGAIGATVHLRAQLKVKADDRPVANHTVRFTVDGQPAGSDQTDGDGVAKVVYTVPNQMGSKRIEAHFAGNTLCTGAHDDGPLGVIKSSTRITLDPPEGVIRRGDTLRIQGAIVRITDNKGLDGRAIVVKIGSLELPHLATTPTGKFSLAWTVPKDQPAKATPVEVRFEGDTLYVPTVQALNVTIHGPKRLAYLRWQGAKGRVGETVTLTARLTTPGGIVEDGIPGKQVRLWWGDVNQKTDEKVGSGTTDDNGTAAIRHKIEAPASSYSVHGYADGLRDDWELTIISGKTGWPQLEVSKAPVRVTVSGASSGQIGQTLSIKVRVTRTTDNAPVKKMDVRLPSATKETNDAGEATFDYTIGTAGGVGPRTIAVTTKETTRYLEGAGSYSFQAKPKTN